MTKSAWSFVFAGVLGAGLLVLRNRQPADYEILFGDLHGHSRWSDGRLAPKQPGGRCHRSDTANTCREVDLPEFFAFAAEQAHLDFAAVTDHVEQLPDSSVVGIQDFLRSYPKQAGGFFPIFGFEWAQHAAMTDTIVILPSWQLAASELPISETWRGVPRGFPANPAFAASGLPETPRFASPAKAFEQIRKLAGTLIIDTPTNFAEDIVALAPDLFHNIEIVSSNGEGDFYQYEVQVFALLNRGYRFGLVGVNDAHNGRPGDLGKTAVLAEKREPAAVVAALRQRHNYALSGERIWLDMNLGKARMGAQVLLQKPGDVHAKARALQPLQKIELIVNSAVVHTATFAAGVNEGELAASVAPPAQDSWLLVKVTLVNGHCAWSSPIWLPARTLA